MRRVARLGVALAVSAAAYAAAACGASAVAGAADAAAVASDTGSSFLTWNDIAALPTAAADARVYYGPDSLRQFGDLRLPTSTAGPFPVAVVVHGGCWSNRYGLDPYSQAAAALARAGIATWTIEYSRVGDARGGWPGTFTDVARGIDAVRTLAARYPLDTARVVLVGHSAGGQLALWAAARSPLPTDAPPDTPAPPTLRIRGVVTLAGIPDLAAYASTACGAALSPLLGGAPSDVPGRYHAVSPIARLPIGVPMRLVYGTRDPIVAPDQSTTFAQQATAAGDDAAVRAVPGAGHFELIAPATSAWATVIAAVEEVVRDGKL